MVTGQLLVLPTFPEFVQRANEDVLVSNRIMFNVLQVDEEQRPMNFCQTFTISHDTDYYVKNDLFALVFG